MAVLMDNSWEFRFVVTKTLCDFLRQNGVAGQVQGDSIWKVGDTISAMRDSRLHSYSLRLWGKQLPELRAFSFTVSPLTRFCKIGRYCSISTKVEMMGGRHEYNFVSTTELLFRHNGFFHDAYARFGTNDSCHQ